MRKFLFVLILIFCSLGNVWAQPELAGHWQGSDWGEVEIFWNGESGSGTYTSTFNGKEGSLTFEGRKSGRSYLGSWRESSATPGHPLRQGRFRLDWTQGDDHCQVFWESCDGDSTRESHGESLWVRGRS